MYINFSCSLQGEQGEKGEEGSPGKAGPKVRNFISKFAAATESFKVWF